jgi:hypothetical protein
LPDDVKNFFKRTIFHKFENKTTDSQISNGRIIRKTYRVSIEFLDFQMESLLRPRKHGIGIVGYDNIVE